MLSYVAPNFIMLKNILASFNITHLSPLFHCSTKVKERDILHIYTPTFVSSLFKERGMLHLHSARFVSWYHGKERDITETLYFTKINYLCFSLHFTWKNSGDMTQHFWRVNFRATKPFTIVSIPEYTHCAPTLCFSTGSTRLILIRLRSSFKTTLHLFKCSIVRCTAHLPTFSPIAWRSKNLFAAL